MIDNKKNDKIRINKYLSMSGITSRRRADSLIEEGKVLINDKIASKGDIVFQGDTVKYNGNLVYPSKKNIILAFNKPRGLVCTSRHFDGETNIYEFINYKERIFSIGRLDKDSNGLILLTNNGEIANNISKSKNNIEKEYLVEVDRIIKSSFVKNMSNGISILGTITKKCKVRKIDDYHFNIILTQGLNRQIRRMCIEEGYKVKSLKRIRVANIFVDKIKEGDYRMLSSSEMESLISLADNEKQESSNR